MQPCNVYQRPCKQHKAFDCGTQGEYMLAARVGRLQFTLPVTSQALVSTDMSISLLSVGRSRCLKCLCTTIGCSCHSSCSYFGLRPFDLLSRCLLPYQHQRPKRRFFLLWSVLLRRNWTTGATMLSGLRSLAARVSPHRAAAPLAARMSTISSMDKVDSCTTHKEVAASSAGI